MSIEDVVARREICEILHFTTHMGLTGILDSRLLKSRNRLHDDQRLEYILNINTPIVKDPGWEDFVNLSITRINTELFEISSKRYHPELWWCVLAFDPVLLADDGVVFATANNIWPSTIRGKGEGCLESMFLPEVRGKYGVIHRRHIGMPDSYTTCDQAEVLYPGEISTQFLRRIYVQEPDQQDDVRGLICAIDHTDIDIVVNDDVFRGGIIIDE